MQQWTAKLLPLSTCIFLFGTIFALLAVTPPAAAASDGPGFNDPQGLCNALVDLPTKGWHHGSGWYCVSALQEFGSSASYGRLPSTFQYYISGDSYTHAQKVKLIYNKNNPASRTSSLRRMALYAKHLSRNTTFHLSKKMLSKIEKGTPFSIVSDSAKISFSLIKGRVDVYKLVISSIDK